MEVFWLQKGKSKLARVAYRIAGNKAHVVGMVSKKPVNLITDRTEARAHFLDCLSKGYVRIGSPDGMTFDSLRKVVGG